MTRTSTETGRPMDLPALYRMMMRSRAFEVAVAGLWKQGLVSGEMHLGTGEEAVAAGVVSHVRRGDGLALDHRGTPELVMRGVGLVPLLREMLGREDGLCRGRGGHMHLSSREHLVATSGIVGASGPMAAGFALAAKRLRPGSIGVCFFGEGAMNQGMLMEALNLATVWSLPQLFVCKNNGWAIGTVSSSVTAGTPLDRARSFGMHVEAVDGLDVRAVHEAGGEAIERARRGRGPTFLHATVSRLDGHYLGDPMVESAKDWRGQGKEMLGKALAGAIKRGGGGVGDRLGGVLKLVRVSLKMAREVRDRRSDPIEIARRSLKKEGVDAGRIDDEVETEVAAAVEEALGNP